MPEIPGTPTPQQIEQELRAINLLANESGWEQPASCFVIQAIKQLDNSMIIQSVKVEQHTTFWGDLGEGDPIKGLYIYARALMDSIQGVGSFPDELLDPLITELPVAAVFLAESYQSTPEVGKSLEPGQRLADLPEEMRVEQRSLHGVDNQGRTFMLNQVRKTGEITYEHQADFPPGVRGLGRMPIVLKMLLDAAEAHFIMNEREELNENSPQN